MLIMKLIKCVSCFFMDENNNSYQQSAVELPHKFHCQTSRKMEALQPLLNNTKTNCFSCFLQEQYA